MPHLEGAFAIPISNATWLEREDMKCLTIDSKSQVKVAGEEKLLSGPQQHSAKLRKLSSALIKASIPKRKRKGLTDGKKASARLILEPVVPSPKALLKKDKPSSEVKVTSKHRNHTAPSLHLRLRTSKTLQPSKSSQVAHSLSTSPSEPAPSNSVSLKAESSKFSSESSTPTTPSAFSSSSLLISGNQPCLTDQIEKQRNITRGRQSHGDTVMSLPTTPPSMRPPQNELSHPSTAERRHHQTRNYQSRTYSQENHSNWRDYSFLDLYVTHLPTNVTTLQIWRNFKKYGELHSININDNELQYSARTATITFKPPPSTPFWEHRDGVVYQHGDKTYRYVQVRLDRKQRKNHVVESIVRPGIVYNEEHVLIGVRIDFGVLTDPSSMLVLESRKSEGSHQVKFQLDLRKKEITTYFPSAITSDNSGLITRDFRFRVSLDQHFVLSQVDDSENEIVLLLEVDKPPPCSKKLKEAANKSHINDAKLWLAEDLWARQTDIVDTKAALNNINKTPVSVRNSFVSIDMGRWLAYRITVLKSQSNTNTLSIMQSALKDFNCLVNEKPKLGLKIATPADEPIIWKVLDKHKTVGNGTASSNLRDLMNSYTTLSFPVRYQLEVCVSHNYLSEYTIEQAFLSQLASLSPTKALQFLKAVDLRGQKFLKPADIFEELEFRKPVRKPKLPDNCIEIHHATVTPTKIYFNTPSVEITNRVIRQYKQHADRFLRVRFEDDDYRGSTRLFPSVNNKMTNIFERVRRTLTHGIEMGDRHYKFLAWGNSQLREHGAYFFADLPGVITAGNIRAKMGEFSHEKIVAKRAARMGQCFSTTRSLPSRMPRIHQSVCIPDVRAANQKYIFTDGVGKMSDLVASMAGIQMHMKGASPSVIQFRLGGCKGVLAHDPSLDGRIDIEVRDSQFKFVSGSNDLELIRCSSFANADLNRQLILVLSELGVENEVFLKKQEDLMDEIENAMISDDAAVKALKDRVDPNFVTPVIANMISIGKFRSSNEPFLISVLHLWRSWSLKYLKEKAKLPIPQSAFVLGCTDETQILRGHFDHLQPPENSTYEEKEKSLPEIFIQVTDPLTQKVTVIQGICVVARNPSLHKGDVRVVKAVDVPALHHLRDVVVFPQTGDRDLPSMCSGGDLDGDDFVVIWDEELLPREWNAPPFHYDPPRPVQAEGDVTTEQIISFFVDYMENDFLGRIAHAHLAWADDKGLESDQCLELVQLHSLSVDFPKTGVPARMVRQLERGRKGWPHFMEKKGGSYRSYKILGKLYDAVEKADFVPKYKASFDSRILNALQPSEQLYQYAKVLKRSYDEDMQQIMAQHEIKTEFEVWSTFVLDHSKKSNDYKFHEEIGKLSAALKEQYFDDIASHMGGRDLDHLAPFAVAAYQVTRAEVDDALEKVLEEERDIIPSEMPFISFPWVLHDTLSKIAAGAAKRSVVGESSQGLDEGGIRFDEDGTPIQPSLRGNLTSLQGGWLGQRLADPYKDDLASPRSNTESEAIRDALADTKVLPVEQSDFTKDSKGGSAPGASSGSSSDVEGSAVPDGHWEHIGFDKGMSEADGEVVEGHRHHIGFNRDLGPADGEATVKDGTAGYADPGAECAGSIGSGLDRLRIEEDSDSD
jgi:RNA-dependent RNA polymerase